jgi:hypothetical protein
LARLPRNRLVAFLAACALIACAAVYSAHDLGDRTHQHSHCDLCVHFSGSAGAQAHAAVIAKAPLLVRAVPARAQSPRPARSPLGAHLPRGPPADMALT